MHPLVRSMVSSLRPQRSENDSPQQPPDRTFFAFLGVRDLKQTIAFGLKIARITGIAGITATIVGWCSPSLGAARLSIALKSFEFSLPITDLETYAKTGVITQEFDAYARAVPPESLSTLREILQRPANLNPYAVSRMVYTPIGDIVLRRLGAVLQTGSHQNGALALRSAFVQAAAAPDGLTLLNVLKAFPTPEIRVDLDAALAVAQEAVNLYYERESLITAVQTQSIQESQTQTIAPGNPHPIDYNQLPDLRQPGTVTWQRQSLDFTDPSRQRSVPTDIYWPNYTGKAPLVVISHGVGGDRSSFAYLAQHLASYGFVVIVPEHIGSNAKTVQDFFQGLTEPLPQEALDRPWDVTFILNTLQYFSQISPAWEARLDLNQVGVIGQSFGGYTALALGGATLNFDELGKECAKPEPDNASLNISFLLQCTTYLLPRQSYLLRDPRIKATIAINPFTSHIFGKTGLGQVQVPTLLVASGDDLIVPAGPEQFYPFTWLEGQPRYLALFAKGTHFSTLSEEETQQGVFAIPPTLLGADPRISHRYLNALSVAFLRSYLMQDSLTPLYLQASYGQFLNEPAMPLSFMQSLPVEVLDAAVSQRSNAKRKR